MTKFYGMSMTIDMLRDLFDKDKKLASCAALSVFGISLVFMICLIIDIVVLPIDIFNYLMRGQDE